MSNFINNIANRHMQPAGGVQPRLRGRFETPAPPVAAEPDNVEPFPLAMPAAPVTTAPVDPSSPKRPGPTGGQDHLPENVTTVKEIIPADIFSPEKIKLETIPPVTPAAPTVPPLLPLYDNKALETTAPHPPAFVMPPDRVANGNEPTPVTAAPQIPSPQAEYVRHHEAPQLAEEARSWLRGSSPNEPRRQEAADRQPPAAPPVIQISIGRIEVRAVTATAPAKTPPASTPVMSLDEFLKRKK
jgi:hypothetical protein